MAPPILVVARYDEPEWQVPGFALGTDVHVVVKGEDVPNEGRETASYFWWMWQNVNTLDHTRTYAFLQGDPWIHGIVPRNFREVQRYTPLGTYRVECDWDGAPHHPGLPLERLWYQWDLGAYKDKPESLRFVSGGQFLVPGWDIKRYSAGHYNWMYHQQREEPEAPWCMERFWPHFWRTP